MSTDTAYLASNWAEIRQRVDDACRAAGRDPATVGILPVSKTFGPDMIRAAAALGLRRFGENRVQEIRDKAAVLADCGIDWVVIGHLQTNKVKEVARLASEVQSLDRLELALALHRQLQQAGRSMDVLVQVKTSPEPGKYGLPPAQLPSFLDTLHGYDTLRVRGLMTLAIHSDVAADVRGCFHLLHQLRDQAMAQGHDL
ncbi:MAG TPA: YggS family pyridoxal phosphate-dependent enzyme, partial [Rhodanobacter sp.]